ncbi:hypothetical protein Lal_00044995 [Lupinus albus]|nr:hypothetical protein Lal_00044995 [Lupinus albus]
MAGRGRGNRQNEQLAQMAAAILNVNENLQHLNQNINHHPNPPPLVRQGPAEYHGLDEFCRRHPSQFQGGFAPDAANEWIQELEKIFRAMGCGMDFDHFVLKSIHNNFGSYLC